MKVRDDEGVANRIGPEPCSGAREGVGEASVGECIGQQLSRERVFVPGADTVVGVEGNTCGRGNASAHVSWRGRRTWHVQTLLVSGNREISRSTARYKPPVRVGKVRSHSR